MQNLYADIDLSHRKWRMEDRKLIHFIAVVEEGSILAASERVSLTQPALSRSITELERILDVPLLVRHAKGVTLTPYGEVLYRNARLMRNQARVTREELKALSSGVAGHLRIGIGPSFSARIVPLAISEMVKSYPDVTFDVVEGSHDQLLHLLEGQDIDAAFSLFPLGEIDAAFSYETLFESSYQFVFSVSHPLAGHARIDVASLARENWALFSRPKSLITHFNRFFTEAGAPVPHISVTTDSMLALIRLLTGGRFVSILTRELVAEECSTGLLRALDMSPKMPTGSSGVITRTKTTALPALEKLVSCIKAQPGWAILQNRSRL